MYNFMNLKQKFSKILMFSPEKYQNIKNDIF